jgi:DNA-binding CsgD family transcriptional regulator
LLEAIAQDALGDEEAAGRALERSLDLAEPDGMVWWFLLHPMSGLLDRHAGHRTVHAALIAGIRSMLAGTRTAPPPARPMPPEPLSESELRVLRYLPTNLTAPEIARELSVSPNTARTHIRHVYTKLGAHHRAEAVEHARELGLLAPAGRLLARESAHGRSEKSKALCRTARSPPSGCGCGTPQAQPRAALGVAGLVGDESKAAGFAADLAGGGCGQTRTATDEAPPGRYHGPCRGLLGALPPETPQLRSSHQPRVLAPGDRGLSRSLSRQRAILPGARGNGRLPPATITQMR